jgi:hypothetical protein
VSPQLDNTNALRVLPAFTARRLLWAWNGLLVPVINNWDMSFVKNTRLSSTASPAHPATSNWVRN